MDMILETTNLCKNFKGHLAVNQVSLHIERNSIYGLLRPNGAGKSTMLKMITGILNPSKQQLGIAIALLNNPKLLILDAPTNGLDPVGIEELRELYDVHFYYGVYLYHSEIVSGLGRKKKL